VLRLPAARGGERLDEGLLESSALAETVVAGTDDPVAQRAPAMGWSVRSSAVASVAVASATAAV
jgi:hypothetical protein